LGVAHTKDGVFLGMMEFFLTKDAKENGEYIARVKASILR